MARGGSLKADPGFVSMFNGQDLTGWSGSPDLWSVRDGAIVGQTTKEKPALENTFLIWTNGQPGDFEMRCSFKITANNNVGFANSGVQFRSRVVKPSYWVVAGYQADMEASTNYTGGLYEEKGRGTLVDGWKGKAEKVVKLQDWNDYEILCDGDHIKLTLNGMVTADLHDSARLEGIIAFQLHRGPPMEVYFRNVRIKILK